MTLLTKPGSRSFVLGPRSLAVAVLVISLVTVGIVPSQAQAAKAKARVAKEQNDPREMQAREAFAAGSYKEALDIYAKLYAEKLHPTYLRNIGRCYQNLNEPDRAISSFREYLRKAKAMPADERAEVETYIKEMEELQRKNAAAAKPPEPVVQPLPTAAPPVAPVAPPPQPLVVVQQPAPVPASGPAPFYKRAWFWSVVGVVVVAGTVGGLWAGGAFSSSQSKPACPAGIDCFGP